MPARGSENRGAPAKPYGFVGRAAALAEPKIVKLSEGMDLVKPVVVKGRVSLIFKPRG